MTTLKAATSGGGAKRREAQSGILHALYERCTQPHGFLLPKDYASCTHEAMYVCLDSGYSICSQCGGEHFCCCGKCPEIITHQNARVCAITGCVTLESEFKAERNINERCGPTLCKTRDDDEDDPGSCGVESTVETLGSASRKVGARKRGVSSSSSMLESRVGTATAGKRRATIKEIITTKGGGGEHLRSLVECTVREILQSDKTQQCMIQERKRNESRENSVLARAVREVSHIHVFCFLILRPAPDGWCVVIGRS